MRAFLAELYHKGKLSGGIMRKEEFEEVLNTLTERLTQEVCLTDEYHKPSAFEDRVRVVLAEILIEKGEEDALDPSAQGFPDIVVDEYGIEVKATESDSWRCIANSVSEGTRNAQVNDIYIVYGKMGGEPEVRWASYGKAIIHVRTSHVPRFEIDLSSDRSLFEIMGVEYEHFRHLEMHEKMEHIRDYARGRLKPGERLWWLEDTSNDTEQHTLPIEVKLYMELPQEEKRRLRGEAALLSPGVVGGSRARRKYVDPVMYLMTYRGVLCPQARDLFSAGSVALRADGTRGGNYILRALEDIQNEMRLAAQTLETALFLEYWGQPIAPENRIRRWLELADEAAVDWTPSDYLFLHEQERDG